MEKLALHKPVLAEMIFRRQLLADEATMAYNARWGGTIDFAPERWPAWFARWVSPGEDGRFYRYLYAPDEKAFVGEIAWHFDDSVQAHLCDVMIHAAYRGKGYGREGLRLLCRAARERGLTHLHDHIALDNPAIHLFVQEGFAEVLRDDEGILLMKKL